MIANSIEVKVSNELEDSLLDYLGGDFRLLSFYNYILHLCIERLLFEPDLMKRYSNWFFFNFNQCLEDTRLGDEEIAERIHKLEQCNLINLKENIYEGSILMKVDIEMIKAIYKLHKSNKI